MIPWWCSQVSYHYKKSITRVTSIFVKWPVLTSRSSSSPPVASSVTTLLWELEHFNQLNHISVAHPLQQPVHSHTPLSPLGPRPPSFFLWQPASVSPCALHEYLTTNQCHNVRSGRAEGNNDLLSHMYFKIHCCKTCCCSNDACLLLHSFQHPDTVFHFMKDIL